jgi:hypothetical protein
MISVLLYEDNPQLREGLTMLIMVRKGLKWWRLLRTATMQKQKWQPLNRMLC